MTHLARIKTKRIYEVWIRLSICDDHLRKTKAKKLEKIVSVLCCRKQDNSTTQYIDLTISIGQKNVAGDVCRENKKKTGSKTLHVELKCRSYLPHITQAHIRTKKNTWRTAGDARGRERERERDCFSERKIKVINRHDLFSVVIKARQVVCSLQLDLVFLLVCQGDHLLHVLHRCSLRSSRPVAVRMWAGDSTDVDIDNRHYDGDWYSFHSYVEGRQKSSGGDSQHDELHW